MITAALASDVAQVDPSPTDISRPLVKPNIEYSALLPELIMVGGGLLILLIASLVQRKPRPGIYATLTMLTGAASAAAALWQWHHYDLDEGGGLPTVVNAVALDGFSVFFAIAIARASSEERRVGEEGRGGGGRA